MDDHDQWNPDMDELETKITSLKSVLETLKQGRGRQHRLIMKPQFIQVQVQQISSQTPLKDPICTTYHGISRIPQGRYLDRSKFHSQ